MFQKHYLAYIIFSIIVTLLWIYRLGTADIRGVELGLYSLVIVLAIKAYRDRKG